jgi:glycosyltransferase involved in cell wall biosynthesis
MIAKEFRKLNRSDQNSRIIWTRDPIVALFVPRNQELVLELHHEPSKLDAQVCKVLNLRRNLVICTLTNAHIDAIQPSFAKHRVCLTPMAVNPEFFLNQKKISGSESIAFLGKGWSSGHDNNLLKILNEIALYKNEFNEDLTISFLGLEDEYQAKLQQSIFDLGLESARIMFKSHINHDEVPEFLKDVSIGLIPYECTEYNNQRFPIKALEYAAAGVTILATDIPIHTKILSDKFCYFYSPDIPGDLGRALRIIFADSLSRQVKIQKAGEWASLHTYLNRVNVVLNALSELRDGTISHG